MKARDIIMVILILLVLIIGIRMQYNKNIKTLTCTTNSNFHGMDSIITLNVQVSNNEIRDIGMIIDATLEEEYLSNSESLAAQLGADGRMKVTTTEKGLKLETDMNSQYFQSLGLNTKTSYNEFKNTLEFQGYKCE